MSSGSHLDTLPDDVAALKALIHAQHQQLQQRERELDDRQRALQQRDAQLTEQQITIAQLAREKDGIEHRMHLLLRRLYGPRSERMHPNQLLLFSQAIEPPEQPPGADTDADGDPATASPARRKRPGRGRRPLPEDLPRHRIEHPADPEQLSCPCCGEARRRIGERISEQLEYAPSSLFVLQHVQGKYACKRCEEGGVATAEKQAAEVIEKGLPGPGLVAHVATSKYCDHLPLYRQERMLARHGVTLGRSTLCTWLKHTATLVLPLHRLMCERIRQSKVIHTDDTPLPVQQKGRGRTKTGRLWVYLGDSANPYTIYEYTPSRSRDGPVAWLEQFKGYLQADAFGGYDGIYARSGGGEVIEVACWAHARRKFHDARGADPARAHHALGLIRQLYDVEEQGQSLDAVDRLDLRQREAVPVLDELEEWLNEHRDALLPKHPMSVAVNYALNQWDALRRYADDGDLAIDNNVAERAIRPLAIGRKNYLFAGNDGGGQTAAILYSLIASAQRHGLDPFAYLRDVFARIGDTPVSDLEQFFPDRWRQTFASNAPRTP